MLSPCAAAGRVTDRRQGQTRSWKAEVRQEVLEHLSRELAAPLWLPVGNSVRRARAEQGDREGVTAVTQVEMEVAWPSPLPINLVGNDWIPSVF